MSDLTVGYASAEITPPLGVAMAGYSDRTTGATGVNDPLMAQALVLGSGGVACALISTDLVGLDEPVATEVRRRSAERSGIPAENVMVCSSHTHWGPTVSPTWYTTPSVRETISAQYRRDLVETLAGLVETAREARAPGVAGSGNGFADGITFNRRLIGPTGEAAMQYTLPPEQAAVASREGNRLARAWARGEHKGPRLSAPLADLAGDRVGVADGEVVVLRVDGSDGRPMVGMVNFAGHAVCGGGDHHHFSADYPGWARLGFEALIGAPLLFAAGCSGDQVPRWRGDGSRERVGKSLAAEAARTWLAIEDSRDDVPLACARQVAMLPMNPNIPSVPEAEAKLAAHADPDDAAANMDQFMLQLAKEIANHPDGYPAEIWAMRIGDLGLVAIPGEPFAEIGLQIKQRSPFAQTMVVSCANGLSAYMPTDDGYTEGAYEPSFTPSGPGSERVLVDTGLALLNQLAQSSTRAAPKATEISPGTPRGTERHALGESGGMP